APTDPARRASPPRPPQGRGRRPDRLAVLYPAGSEGRQGAPHRARSYPRHPEELGLSAESKVRGAELARREPIPNQGRPAGRPDAFLGRQYARFGRQQRLSLLTLARRARHAGTTEP